MCRVSGGRGVGVGSVFSVGVFFCPVGMGSMFSVGVFSFAL